MIPIFKPVRTEVDFAMGIAQKNLFKITASGNLQKYYATFEEILSADRLLMDGFIPVRNPAPELDYQI